MLVRWGACKEREGQGSCHHTLSTVGWLRKSSTPAGRLPGDTARRRKHQVGPFGREAVGETGVPGRGRFLGTLRESPSGCWTPEAHGSAKARGPQPFMHIATSLHPGQ